MADYRSIIGVGRPRPLFFGFFGRTEPDLDLIKQVEQVSREMQLDLALELDPLVRSFATICTSSACGRSRT
jgi:hypothetical protein